MGVEYHDILKRCTVFSVAYHMNVNIWVILKTGLAQLQKCIQKYLNAYLNQRPAKIVKE